MIKRLLFWSHIDLAWQDDFSKACHNDPARMYGLAQGFRDLGWDVHVATIERKMEQDDFLMGERLRRRHINNLKADEYDVVFFFPNLAVVSFLELLMPPEDRWRFKHFNFTNREELLKLSNHKRVFVRLDVPGEQFAAHGWFINKWIADRATAVGIYTYLGLQYWRENYPAVKSFLSLNATTNNPPSIGDNPYPKNGRVNNPRKKILWVGRLPYFHFKMLDDIAKEVPQFDVYVISGKIVDYKGDYHDPRETDPLTFHKKMDKAKGIFKSKNIVYLGGLSYKNTFPWMRYADICLGLSVRKNQNASSGKIFEYLGVGSPVVMDEEVPEAWLKRECDIGEIAKYGSIETIVEKIKILSQRFIDRNAIKKYIMENHTWGKRAQEFNKVMEESFAT